MTEPILFCRIGWMRTYQGLEAEISGAGAGHDIGNEWEAYNFSPYRGRVYGYLAAGRSRTIDIGRLGGSGDSVSGVTVVWISPHPQQGRQRIVGWYRNATVFRDLQDNPQGRPCEASDGSRVQYHVVAAEADARLLPPAERSFSIPRPRGFMGQSNTSYMESDIAASLVTEVRAYIQRAGSASAIRFADEVPGGQYTEGATAKVTVNAFERDPRARRACIAHWGTDCRACGASMGAIYGNDVDGLIHVHHLSPLSSVRHARGVDPIRDLRPVCPNCHAVIHHCDPPLTLDEVRALMERASRVDR